MQLLYAFIFFLFGTSVVSTPLRDDSRTPAPGQWRHHQGYGIQRAATSLGHRPPALRPEDGYWVLKRPQQANRYPDQILHISNQVYRVFSVDNHLRLRDRPMESQGEISWVWSAFMLRFQSLKPQLTVVSPNSRSTLASWGTSHCNSSPLAQLNGGIPPVDAR